jgi:hypothetical protein
VIVSVWWIHNNLCNQCLSPIWRGFAPGFVNYIKGCTRLSSASDKVYQLLAHGRWFSPGTHAFCLLALKSSEKWWSPLFGATCNFNDQILPYGILYLAFINTDVFYLLSFKFNRSFVYKAKEGRHVRICFNPFFLNHILQLDIFKFWSNIWLWKRKHKYLW